MKIRCSDPLKTFEVRDADVLKCKDYFIMPGRQRNQPGSPLYATAPKMLNLLHGNSLAETKINERLILGD